MGTRQVLPFSDLFTICQFIAKVMTNSRHSQKNESGKKFKNLFKILKITQSVLSYCLQNSNDAQGQIYQNQGHL